MRHVMRKLASSSHPDSPKCGESGWWWRAHRLPESEICKLNHSGDSELPPNLYFQGGWIPFCVWKRNSHLGQEEKTDDPRFYQKTEMGRYQHSVLFGEPVALTGVLKAGRLSEQLLVKHLAISVKMTWEMMPFLHFTTLKILNIIHFKILCLCPWL